MASLLAQETGASTPDVKCFTVGLCNANHLCNIIILMCGVYDTKYPTSGTRAHLMKTQINLVKCGYTQSDNVSCVLG